MGYEDRDYYRDDAATDYDSYGASPSTDLSWSARLIILHLVLFLLNLLSENALLRGVASKDSWIPGLGDTLATPISPWLWWQYLTSGFVFPMGGSLWGLAFTLLALFQFGPEMENIYGRREFLTFYVVSSFLFHAIGGATLFLLVSPRALAESPHALGFAGLGTVGASLFVVLLFCLKFPYRILMLFSVIAVPAWLAGGLFILGSIPYARFPIWLPAGVFMVVWTVAYHHFGWRLSNWFGGRDSGRSIRRGSSWSFARWWRSWTSRPNLKVVREHDDDPPSEAERLLEKEGDRLLEKISLHGEASLSAHERETLRKYSQSLKSKRR